MKTWALLLALLRTTEAITSLVTVTATSRQTTTQISTSTFAITTTTSTCTLGSPNAGWPCTAGVWSSNSKYYQAVCSASLSGGSYYAGYMQQGYSACLSQCESQSTSCAAVSIQTIMFYTYCALWQGAMTAVPGPSSGQVVEIYTTNPCLVTVTSMTTETAVITSTIDYTNLYTSTVIVAVPTPSSSPMRSSARVVIVSSGPPHVVSAASASSVISAKASSSAIASSPVPRVSQSSAVRASSFSSSLLQPASSSIIPSPSTVHPSPSKPLIQPSQPVSSTAPIASSATPVSRAASSSAVVMASNSVSRSAIVPPPASSSSASMAHVPTGTTASDAGVESVVTVTLYETATATFTVDSCTV
ncbi:uncharacterized protein BP01DRAFT_395674 [Aspergillus saccharolyticus JOP 1030-1]|uniref:Apple domain-containing protein n=1 Tax=Aspergillus saccharolyticus JOP 1030-1 TaxID=1450539 RepID=A0A318Z153_9EURO|nr:hypothetical protein BP01DRAFT_395674 [Aspergillus saccharolyticus JOP 1030-1]PYH40726.1 hypothetical protein BP01DRAFT_395674 [Aspergillus saccharolyticus JOP 1030-1]